MTEQPQPPEQPQPGPAVPSEPAPQPSSQPPYGEAQPQAPYQQAPYQQVPQGVPAPQPGYPAPAPMPPDQQRTWASMAHLLTIPAMLVAMAFLAPLIILLAYGNRSEWLRRHAVESLNFQITAILLGVAAGVVSLVTLGLALVVVIPLALVYGVFWLIVIILATFAANRGEDFRYPLTLRLVK